MVDTFVTISSQLVDKSFPLKEVLVGPDDKPYFTEELRKLKRSRQRAYRLYGRRSNKYLQLEERFSESLSKRIVETFDESLETKPNILQARMLQFVSASKS